MARTTSALLAILLACLSLVAAGVRDRRGCLLHKFCCLAGPALGGAGQQRQWDACMPLKLFCHNTAAVACNQDELTFAFSQSLWHVLLKREHQM